MRSDRDAIEKWGCDFKKGVKNPGALVEDEVRVGGIHR